LETILRLKELITRDADQRGQSVVHYGHDATSHTSNNRLYSDIYHRHNRPRRLRCALRREHNGTVLSTRRRVLRL